MPFNVYVTRRIPEAGLEILRRHCDRVEVNPEDRVLSRDELLAAVRDRDGVLCLLTDTIDDETLAAAGPRCRAFANMAVGYNNVDLAAATRRGIMITNTPGVLTETTADLAWALMLAVARRVVEGDRFFRTGRWTGWGPMQFLGHDVHKTTLGIVGAGRIGTAVGRRSVGFGMRLLYTDPHPSGELDRIGARRVDLDTLLRESDFVTLHVALNERTHHLIGRRELALMKPTACLINTARGPIIDEAALVEALRERRIAGAGLDVYENEPEPAPGLVELDNVVCIPHLGSATEATRAKMATMAAENLVAALRGERPPNLVNLDVLAAQS
ncbi:MAG TPA: D-glycerate dehydrogenase [Phycisphaerae bacterium]|jgi:lactate dehydrogenase-like 2-hydroxyacid dehydrogenase|nr:D-glycerate dehydrogenase [Phycisphaerae bacterium]HOB74043.1 D-glycerate dehydrogenase [Phycisphaerae bacterium]HOJ53826.1 D-glycerate dehydrogenase [Phycisphaerae bacterium]HOL26157.1 D-glycerate dehydrogenase [Phycisphaerae bacterium]HPP20144.1 D-glycerate dehydrogenase [Phycisphaerae bacterium]